VAYLIDRLPQELVPAQALAPGFKGTVIDSLLELDEPELFFSKMEITAVGASPALARDLEVNQGSALILFEGYLFTKRGKAIDHSLRYFLPGIFRFHITRRVSYSDHRGRD
jgi:DNA-binding GntR family transcriptional regulator